MRGNFGPALQMLLDVGQVGSGRSDDHINAATALATLQKGINIRFYNFFWNDRMKNIMLTVTEFYVV